VCPKAVIYRPGSEKKWLLVHQSKKRGQQAACLTLKKEDEKKGKKKTYAASICDSVAVIFFCKHSS